jgi:large subunit ribosomal protein L29
MGNKIFADLKVATDDQLANQLSELKRELRQIESAGHA